MILEELTTTEALSVDGKNSENRDIGNITSLGPKDIETLKIISCNAGHLGTAYSDDMNVAQAFLKIDGIDNVIAYDGSVGFGPFFGDTSEYNSEYNDAYPRISGDQTAFINLLFSTDSIVLPSGAVAYSSDGSIKIIGWVMP